MEEERPTLVYKQSTGQVRLPTLASFTIGSLDCAQQIVIREDSRTKPTCWKTYKSRRHDTSDGRTNGYGACSARTVVHVTAFGILFAPWRRAPCFFLFRLRRCGKGVGDATFADSYNSRRTSLCIRAVAKYNGENGGSCQAAPNVRPAARMPCLVFRPVIASGAASDQAMQT